jgi:hypothetical protein
MILGVLITIGTAYVYDSGTGRVANGLTVASAEGHAPMVNWDVVSHDWDGMKQELRDVAVDIEKGWPKLVPTSAKPFFKRRSASSLPRLWGIDTTRGTAIGAPNSEELHANVCRVMLILNLEKEPEKLRSESSSPQVKVAGHLTK